MKNLKWIPWIPIIGILCVISILIYTAYILLYSDSIKKMKYANDLIIRIGLCNVVSFQYIGSMIFQVISMVILYFAILI
jgi:hypothetical protein